MGHNMIVLTISAIFLFVIKMSLGSQWTPVLQNEDITCPIELPFERNNSDPNLLVSIKADNFATCAREASKMIEREAKYFFYSLNENPFGKTGGSNCVVFKSCDGRKLTDLENRGYTYWLCPSMSNKYRTRNIQKNRRVKRSGRSTFYVPTKICQHDGHDNCDPETCEYAVGGAVGGEPDNVPDGHAVPNPKAATVKELKLDCNKDEDENIRNTRCKCELFDAKWGQKVYEYFNPPGTFEVEEDNWIGSGKTKTRYWFKCDTKIMPLIIFYNEPSENFLCEIETQHGKDDHDVKICLQRVKEHLELKGKLIWLVHGFRGSEWKMKNEHWHEVKNILLNKYPTSVVGFVIWEEAASISAGLSISDLKKTLGYYYSAVSIRPVANILAYVHFEIHSRLGEHSDLGDNTYCIGHSLGAHLCSFYAKRISQLTVFKFQVQKILGLDPAGPLFEEHEYTHRLHRSNANFVEVWHTNTHNYGIKKPIGHVDIYINGGYLQPGSGREFPLKDRKSHNVAKIIPKHVIDMANGCSAKWLCTGIGEIEEWDYLQNILDEDRVTLTAVGCRALQTDDINRFLLGQLDQSRCERSESFVYWVHVSPQSSTCELDTIYT